ncbi:MAG: hypothetical protein Q7T64_00190 [Lacisediminimonas sp.]|nr:hypothetical protein [Lacisediminimonas sp.]
MTIFTPSHQFTVSNFLGNTMTAMTATSRHFNSVAATRSLASRPAKSASPSLWSLISKSLEMAHIVGEFGSVSNRQMAQIRSIAAKL